MDQGLEAIPGLMARFRKGDREAAGELVEMFYPQLRQIAGARMRRESPGHTWQTTGLVNELYLELVKVKALRAGSSDGDTEREAFLKLCSHLMRRLLIHHVRPLPKRTGRGEMPENLADLGAGVENLQQIDDLLSRLAEVDPELRTVVELRVFEGLTQDEIAVRMGCSLSSVNRRWRFAQTWLSDALVK